MNDKHSIQSGSSQAPNHVRYQGYLLKKRKNTGFKIYWVVLSNGHIIYYKNEKEAQNQIAPKKAFCLNNAFIKDFPNAGPRSYRAYSFAIYFPDCKQHTLCTLALPKKKGYKKLFEEVTELLKHDRSKINARFLYVTNERKEKWINAVKQTIVFSNFNSEPCETCVEDKIEKNISTSDQNYPKKTDKTPTLIRKESVDEEYFDTTEEFLNQDIINRCYLKSSNKLDETTKKIDNSAFCIDKVKVESNLEWRRKLPAEQIDRNQISLWEIIKNAIGKELTRITMPVHLCEPLSILQRFSESAQYSNLLDKALDHMNDPCKRMEYIAAFATSSCSAFERLTKPFNSILGETYELVREDLGFKLVAEQVSHHPPITALFVESTNQQKYWKYYGNFVPKIRIWGKTLHVTTHALLTVEFPSLNETYTWRAIPCQVHNILFGTLWFEFSGKLEIVSHQTDCRAILNFHSFSLTNEYNKVDGYIYDKNKKKQRAIWGYWSQSLNSCQADSFDSYKHTNKSNLPIGQVGIEDFCEVWKITPAPLDANKYYKFSYFTMSMNQLKHEFGKLIAPTDSRFRTDIRQLELGNIDEASKEKNRLEEKQREARRKDLGDFKPMWFDCVKHSVIDEEFWYFNHKYWLRDFKNCPDIF